MSTNKTTCTSSFRQMWTVYFPGEARNDKREVGPICKQFFGTKNTWWGVMRCREVMGKRAGLAFGYGAMLQFPGRTAAEVHLALAGHMWASHGFTGICKQDVPKVLMPGMWDTARVSWGWKGTSESSITQKWLATVGNVPYAHEWHPFFPSADLRDVQPRLLANRFFFKKSSLHLAPLVCTCVYARPPSFCLTQSI